MEYEENGTDIESKVIDCCCFLETSMCLIESIPMFSHLERGIGKVGHFDFQLPRGLCRGGAFF